jgi:hypothetical protein
MHQESIRNFIVNEQEYFINLEDIDDGLFGFKIQINNSIYDFVYDDILHHFKCLEILNYQSSEIFNKEFIDYHVTNFFTIFDRKKFLGIGDENIIEFEDNKLILSNDDKMFFFDNSLQILYEVEDYYLSLVKLIYEKNSTKRINYVKSQKKLNNLIKFNYDLLELKLLKIEINNLYLHLQHSSEEELVNELNIELKKLEQEYKLKLISALDARNHDYQKNNRKFNTRYFSIIFNNSWLFRVSKKLINFIEIEYYLYKSLPTLYILFFSKIFNAFLVPIIDLMLGITNFMSFNYYYEKKIEIDEQREKLAEIIHNFHAITKEQQLQNGILFKLFSNFIDFIFLYSFEMIYFLLAEILSIFQRPIYLFKKNLAFI